jgi:hypothetical protein
MAGINTISDFYNKHGEDKLRHLLSSDIRITEKYDAHRFSFEKTDRGFVFFGKNSNKPLTRIDRTISDLYEKAIQHVENLPKEISSQLPKGQRFSFYYFPTNKPNKVEYDKVPKNNLVLSNLSIRRGDKIMESITNHEVIKRWSNILNTDCDNPIFEGKIEDHKLESLIESARSGDSIDKLFETNANDFLRTDDNFDMEGLIIQCNTDRGSFFLKQDDEKYITESTQKKEQLFDILLMNIYEFLETYKLPKIHDENRSDERYLSIISEMFNTYVSKHGKEFLSLGLKKPEFLSKSGKMSKEWIKNKTTRSILESNNEYEYLLSIFITNLRKEKKTSGLLTESLAAGFNNVVRDIQEISKGSADEFAHLEFAPIVEMESYFVNTIQEDDVTSEVEVEDEIDHMQAIAMMQKVFNHTKRDVKPGDEEVNVLMGNYTLFTNKDLDMIESLNTKNKKRAVIIHVSQDKKNGDKFDFETVKVMKMLSAFAAEHDDLIAGVIIVAVPLLSEAFKGLRPKYEPISFSVNGSCTSLEIEYKSRKWLNTEFPPDLELNSYSSHIDPVYDTLENGSIADFSKLVPEIVSKYFMDYQSEYRKFIYVN